jgi:hypothetical protein
MRQQRVAGGVVGDPVRKVGADILNAELGHEQPLREDDLMAKPLEHLHRRAAASGNMCR